MKYHTRIDVILVSLAVSAIVLLAGSTHPEKALWIKITEHGKLKTTIAITEPIARLIAESDKDHVRFSSHNDRDLVTRDMMKAVLNGRTSSVTGEDTDEDTKAEVFMKNLDLPGTKGNNSRFILETYKNGKRTFRIKLGEFEIENSDDENGKSSKSEFSWKSLLPFLSKTGGGVYIHDHNDDTEVWIFVE
jgi:hypothetical protein